MSTAALFSPTWLDSATPGLLQSLGGSKIIITLPILSWRTFDLCLSGAKLSNRPCFGVSRAFRNPWFLDSWRTEVRVFRDQRFAPPQGLSMVPSAPPTLAACLPKKSTAADALLTNARWMIGIRIKSGLWMDMQIVGSIFWGVQDRERISWLIF